jgi:hypothetical protein
MQRTDTFSAVYDVEAWRAARDEPLSAFRAPEPISWRTSMDPEWRAIIEQRLATYGEHPGSLGKMTRTVFANQLRQKLVRVHPPALESPAEIAMESVSSAA